MVAGVRLLAGRRRGAQGEGDRIGAAGFGSAAGAGETEAGSGIGAGLPASRSTTTARSTIDGGLTAIPAKKPTAARKPAVACHRRIVERRDSAPAVYMRRSRSIRGG